MNKLSGWLIRTLASYWLAIAVLSLLLVLTVVGTIEQKDLGLYEVQRRYFTALFVMHPFGPISVPLPGVFLLLIILTLNLICGTVLRLRRRWSNAGLFIVHGGMLILMVGALVTHYFAEEGQMTLAPGDRSDLFRSYHEWELAIIDRSGEKDKEYIADLGDLTRFGNERPYVVQEGKPNVALPFELTMVGFTRNGQPIPKGPMFDAPTPVVNGFFAMPQPVEKENERNLPLAYFEITPRDAPDQKQTALLWGGSALPYTFEHAGKPWMLELRRRAWQVPFTIELKEFRRELHPGTTMAKSYESDIIKHEHGQQTPVTIRMNEPLRNRGFTFFQASFAENPNVPGGFTSTFAVVKNPADQWPLYACVVITAGLLLHFGIKLSQYLRREQGAQKATLAAPQKSERGGAAEPLNGHLATPKLLTPVSVGTKVRK